MIGINGKTNGVSILEKLRGSGINENDLIAITWTIGDQPDICQIIRFERGFIVTKELKTGNRVVVRPGSPYKIEKIVVKTPIC